MAGLAIRVRLERGAAHLVLGAGLGLLLAGVAHQVGGPEAWCGLAGLCVGVSFVILAERRFPISVALVARHLDRRLPELEESATLLLAEPEQLSVLQRIQRSRALRHWDGSRARSVLPHRAFRTAAAIGLGLAALGLVLFTTPRITPAGGGARVRGPAGLGLAGVTLDITPPAYTGARARRVSAGDVAAEEGAAIVWRAHTEGQARAVWLVPSSGDSLQFEPEGKSTWRLVTRAEQSQLARIRVDGPDTLRLFSSDYRVAVVPDRPPTLTIVRPEPRVTFPAESLRPVPVEVLAADDYGVDSVMIAATIASGRGEAVRFRRLRLPFARRERRDPHGLRLQGDIDLPRLGLGAGDELYFHVEATDNRPPTPNRARSETVFLSVRDTTSAPPAEFARLALAAEPEYFRSQRQLILDTEKLLADRRRLTDQVFRARSNELGIDQGLLRLRYGQFLGEEFEETARPGQAAREPDAALRPDSRAAVEDDAQAARAPFVHAHDDTENATLLGAAVKAGLRGAVGAMWQAELHLRTAEPGEALPFEYRALELLKQVQQASRAYVQRVGFEPPPLEVATLRLTGKLTDVTDRRVVTEQPQAESLPATRRALAALGAGRRDPSFGADLEAAGRELAPRAVDDPRLLSLLDDLRQLADSLGAGRPCRGCDQRVERGLWSALPLPQPIPAPRTRHATSVGDRFARLLAGGRP
jgi:hypothetical protein